MAPYMPLRRERKLRYRNNLTTGGHPRGLIRFNWHATRVAAIEFAAIRVEIWIRRRERLLIEDELTSVGISGRAAPITATSATVVVNTKFIDASARARGGASRRRRRPRRQGFSNVLGRKAHIRTMRLRTTRTPISLDRRKLALDHENFFLMRRAGRRQRRVHAALLRPTPPRASRASTSKAPAARARGRADLSHPSRRSTRTSSTRACGPL